MTLVLSAAALVAAAVLLDRLGLWLERRGWIRWRRSRASGVAAAAMAGAAMDVFSPSRQVVESERRHQDSRGDETGSPAPGGVDLDLGVVRLPPPEG